MSRVKLSSLKIYAMKLALYTGGLLYVGIDLFVWQGPLWGMMHDNSKDKTDTAELPPTALTVYGEKLSTRQLERRAKEFQTVTGEQNAQSMAEQDLINNALLRMRARYNDTRIPDFLSEAEEEVERLLTRAASAEQASEWFSSQGYTQESFTLKLAAIMRQEYYLQQILKEQTSVSDSELLSVAGQIGDYLVMPQTRQVSHIFLATLHQDEAAVQAKAEELLALLQANPQRFSELAAQHSQDYRTAKQGGNLGELSVYPSHPLSELNLFGENAIPAHTPTLVRSKWGLHIILAGEIQEPRPLTDEEYADSVRSAIINYKKTKAVDAWFDANIHEANKKNRIIIHGK